MMTLFDDEQVLEAYAKDIKDSTARETAVRMIMNREPLEKIARYVPTLSIEELKRIEAETLQLA